MCKFKMNNDFVKFKFKVSRIEEQVIYYEAKWKDGCYKTKGKFSGRVHRTYSPVVTTINHEGICLNNIPFTSLPYNDIVNIVKEDIIIQLKDLIIQKYKTKKLNKWTSWFVHSDLSLTELFKRIQKDITQNDDTVDKNLNKEGE